MERNQFTFYRSYYEALKHLNKRDRAEVLMAVISYALDEEVHSLSGVPLSVFTLIKPTLDSGRNKANNRKNKTKTKQEQTGKEKEREKEREIEREGEREGEIEREGEDEVEDECLKGAESDPAVAAVMDAYLRKVNPMASQTSLEELTAYVRQMGPECCLRAINIALDEKKAQWSYIRGILRAKAANGVRCIADWDKLDAEREREKAKKAATTNTPSWDDPDYYASREGSF